MPTGSDYSAWCFSQLRRAFITQKPSIRRRQITSHKKPSPPRLYFLLKDAEILLRDRPRDQARTAALRQFSSYSRRGGLEPTDAMPVTPSAKFRRPVGKEGITHVNPPELMKWSSSAIGIKMWRKARFGLNRPLSIKRLTELGEIPPRYAHASFSLRAPCLVSGRVLIVGGERQRSFIGSVFIASQFTV